jgi:hypothetical protein
MQILTTKDLLLEVVAIVQAMMWLNAQTIYNMNVPNTWMGDPYS